MGRSIVRQPHIGRTWFEEQTHLQAGIRFQAQYRRDEDGNLGRIVTWDGKKTGRVIHEGSYDATRALYREMVRTAAAVGPWS